MMRSLYTGRSGLENHQTRMDVIGNNISNVNTVGYKSGRTTFEDTLSQTLKGAASSNGNTGSTNPLQIGLGVKVASVDLMFHDGAPMVTGKNTDLCLSGDGLFIVRGGNEIYYTRDGAFDFDAAGNYVLPGSGHYVQGWMADAEGKINPVGAVGDIRVEKGQKMGAKATDLVNFLYNLNSGMPIVTGVSGGEQVVRTITRTEVNSQNPLPVSFSGKSFQVIGISANLDLSKKWKTKDNIKLGDTTADFINDNGDVVTAKLSPSAQFAVPKGSVLGVSLHILTQSSVTNQYPLMSHINGKAYKVVGINKNLDLSQRWEVKAGGAMAGSNTITITDGNNDVVMTLDSPLTQSLGVKEVHIEKTSTVASEKAPVTVALSDGSSVTLTNGTYKLGNSLPVSTTVTVYDHVGNTYNVPVYFIREGGQNSANKWLVSLAPDTSIEKGEKTKAEFLDAEGNTVTAVMNAVEIQFDAYGNLISDSGSDTTGTVSISGTTQGQNITFDFTALTQYFGSNTVNSRGNGNFEGILKDLTIDSSGIISGTYTNGVVRQEAQVALAHFNNMPGLTKTGTSLYQESANSGRPVTIKAGDFGTVITPGALEMSNTDIANEFSDMIITQRGFQSNAKIITTGDEMIETAVNMKR